MPRSDCRAPANSPTPSSWPSRAMWRRSTCCTCCTTRGATRAARALASPAAVLAAEPVLVAASAAERAADIAARAAPVTLDSAAAAAPAAAATLAMEASACAARLVLVPCSSEAACCTTCCTAAPMSLAMAGTSSEVTAHRGEEFMRGEKLQKQHQERRQVAQEHGAGVNTIASQLHTSHAHATPARRLSDVSLPPAPVQPQSRRRSHHKCPVVMSSVQVLIITRSPDKRCMASTTPLTCPMTPSTPCDEEAKPLTTSIMPARISGDRFAIARCQIPLPAEPGVAAAAAATGALRGAVPETAAPPRLPEWRPRLPLPREPPTAAVALTCTCGAACACGSAVEKVTGTPPAAGRAVEGPNKLTTDGRMGPALGLILPVTIGRGRLPAGEAVAEMVGGRAKSMKHEQNVGGMSGCVC